MRRARQMVAAGLACGVCGCSTTFVAERVDETGLAGDAAAGRAAVFYALPRTVVDVTLPIEVTLTDGGELAGFDRCRVLLAQDPTQKGCTFDLVRAPRFKLLPATAAARAVIDRDQIYRVRFDTSSPFKSAQLSMGFDPATGVSTSVEYRGQNDTAKVIGSVLMAAIKTGATILFSRDPGGPARMCVPDDPKLEVAQRIDLVGRALDDCLDDQTTLDLTRAEVDTLAKLVSDAQRNIPHLADVLRNNGGRDLLQVPGVAATWVQRSESEATAAAAAKAAARKRLHIDGTESVFVASVRSAKSLLPLAPSASCGLALGYPAGATLDTVAKDAFPAGAAWYPPTKDWCALRSADLIVDGNDAGHRAGARIAGELAANRIRFFVRMDPTAESLLAAPDAKPPALAEEGGLRYRMPAAGRIDVLAVQSPDKKTDCTKPSACRVVPLARQTMPVAQYGVVLALPSKFKGNDANLKFELDPATGSLKTLAAGQKGRDGSEITGPLATLQDIQKQRQDAATAAAEAPVKELKNQYDAELYQRCLKALKDLPPDAPKPAICP